MFKIGFAIGNTEPNTEPTTPTAEPQVAAPRKSVVQVSFPGKGTSLAYYNDLFDLKEGDYVFVDGKLEGQRGRVEEVNYNFKIKLSDYKRVIAVADTSVKGEFFFAGSHFVAFDSDVIPAKKVLSWYKTPAKEEEVIISGNDNTSFRLDDLKTMHVGPSIAERGHDYYVGNRVIYLCCDGSKGYAIVKGSEPYEVEFEYNNGEISKLTCSCFCSYKCKHEFAAMLQLKETLEKIEKSYAAEYERTGYFAALGVGEVYQFVVDTHDTGSVVVK